MLARSISEQLSAWRGRPDRKPLVVRGARQVGKTHLVEHWGRLAFDGVVTIDLEREHHLHSVFDQPDPARLLQELALLKGQRLVPGAHLLFLDEIQACPKALAVLRYFAELVPDLHVIAAGSLLDFALRDFAHGMPVGRVEYLFLYPLSFEEFVRATEGDALADLLRSYHVGDSISPAVDGQLTTALRHYLLVGGMPAAVQAYAQQAPLVDVQRIQYSIVATMQDDFAKYGARGQQDVLRRAYRYVAQHVGRKVKYVNISPDRRGVDVRGALDLLAMSRAVHLVHHTSANGVPLGAEASEKHFKSLFMDVGLVNQVCGLGLVPCDQVLTVNEGALAEQLVGQELLVSAPSYQDAPLFYWHREARSANAEVDYVISEGQEVLPVEVKAARGGALRSVFQFLSEKRRTKAVRLYMGTPGLEMLKMPGSLSPSVELLSLPLYLAGQARRLAAEFCHP
ncbi:MAG: ATP-binding protein [Vicinamibacterales bacterium]|nr:ATP-binding protein [Vicinamibacterales bacterium]